VDSSRLLDLPHRTGLRWLASARLARPWRRIRRAPAAATYEHTLRLATVPTAGGRRIQLPAEWDGPLVG
jgi:hypothetical protein